MKSLIFIAVVWMLTIFFPILETILNVLGVLFIIALVLKWDAMIKYENSRK